MYAVGGWVGGWVGWLVDSQRKTPKGRIPKKDSQRKTPKGRLPQEDSQSKTPKGRFPKEDSKRKTTKGRFPGNFDRGSKPHFCTSRKGVVQDFHKNFDFHENVVRFGCRCCIIFDQFLMPSTSLGRDLAIDFWTPERGSSRILNKNRPCSKNS